tara:strand:+ start:109254 stop:109436 length:183 start_codon:yes stop_codon:yes gene_type:complete
VISDPEVCKYGHATPSAERAKTLVAEVENLTLDSTYTAKTAAELIARQELPEGAGRLVGF